MTVKKFCVTCGKEFDALGSWQEQCLDCYRNNPLPKKTSTTKYTGGTTNKTSGGSSYSKSTVQLDPTKVMEELKKTYDEVVATFGEDYPESIADPKTLQAIVSTVFIEVNNRRKGK